MDKVQLLEQYIATLEKQNDAKNRERQTLYTSINDITAELDQLKADNERLKKLNEQIRTQNEQILCDLNQLSLDHRSLTYSLQQKNQQLERVIMDYHQLYQQQQQHCKSVQQIGIMTQTTQMRKSEIYEQVQGQSYRLLQEALHDESEINESLKQTIDKQSERIQQLQYYRQNDRINILNMEQLVKEYEKTEQNLKQQLEQLKQQYHYLQGQMEENCQSNPQNIRQLIENYEKIQELASDQYQQNQNLKYQINQLHVYVGKLEKKLKYYQETPESADVSYAKSVHSQNRRYTHSVQQPHVADVVKQNNKLIQKITQLEREKNQLYVEKSYIHQHKSDRSNPSPLKNVNINVSHKNSSVSKLKIRIDALRQENQSLLEALKLE